MDLLDVVVLALVLSPAPLPPESTYTNDAILGKVILLSHAVGYWEQTGGWDGQFRTISGAANWAREQRGRQKDRASVEACCRHLPSEHIVNAWIKAHDDCGGWECWGRAWREAQTALNSKMSIMNRDRALESIAAEIGWERLYRGDLPRPPLIPKR